jgi:3-oxoacyl-[acyl-carrier-protein] synthase II
VLMPLELAEVAQARHATVLAEVIGYGTAFQAPETEASLIFASADAMERAMRTAIADAGIAAADVDVVASGVSGLKAFDDAELVAIGRVFGPEVLVAAPKAVLGETLGAGGGMGMAAAIAWLQGIAPAPIVRGVTRPHTRVALVTAIGFYGNASAVVLRKPIAIEPSSR